MRAAAQLAFGDVSARCPECRTDPALRARWGCDADADLAIYAIECPRCDGSDPECELCEGSGAQYVKRCPASQVDRSAVRVLKAHRWARDGVLPNAGGLCDQPAELISAFDLVDREHGRIQRERDKRQKEQAKRRK